MFEKLSPELQERIHKMNEASALDIPEFSDEALTRTFSSKHVNDLRYCYMFNKWYRWTEGRWREDDKLHILEMARQHCYDKAADALATIKNKKASLSGSILDKISGIEEALETVEQSIKVKGNKALATSVASARKVAAIATLARADQRHAVAPKELDADPWVLNTPGGIVNLKTGIIAPHDRAALCTKITAVAPTLVGTECPLWMNFLNKIMEGDQERIKYLQRTLGYGLTGITTEHALFFLYGTGGNGKGVLLNTITDFMGDYAVIASMDTFTESKYERHPTELAMLFGARLVTAQETEEGRHWAETRIKALTGGDPISARFMRQDFFKFTPQFKLFIAGNHKPSIRNVNEAIRRRMNLFPFNVRISKEEDDTSLRDKLKHEWPAILRWAIDGCLEWQRIGLSPPLVVQEATNNYLTNEDTFGNWLADCCQKGENHYYQKTNELFYSWKVYCEETKEPVGTQNQFRENLEQRGFEPKRQPGTGQRGFSGIMLKTQGGTTNGF